MSSSPSRQNLRRWLGLGTSAVLVAALVTAGTQAISPGPATAVTPDRATTTPIKHVVVIIDENNSFDHYFGTYPYAANTDGTSFTAAAGTPTNVQTELNDSLLPGSQVPAHNPNSGLSPTSAQYLHPNPNSFQPNRLSASHALTCDQNHTYGAEQSAVNGGLMNKFSATSSTATCATGGQYGVAGLSMDYFDGNTVTGLWNYAQNYAMSDNNWDNVFGPSTPGALDLASGNTFSGTTSLISDPDPNGDSFGTAAAATKPTMAGANVGDLLNLKGVSWGWFQGGFATKTAKTTNVGGAAASDYSAHHAPFQYYASTANKAHTAPASGAEVGHAGPANHEYDLSVFNAALTGTAVNGTVPSLPAVSYIKAPQARDGHAGYSDPLDEQAFLTSEINKIQQSPDWSSTAIVLTYDDSDGWYDHVAPTITNSSTGVTGDTTICTAAAAAHVPRLAAHAGRCGPSQRLPLVVISPYAKKNFVSHVLTSQASVLKFIENNWSTGTIDAHSTVKGSFDAGAANLDDLFDFANPQTHEVLLDSVMYQPGFTDCAGVADYATCINPSFGAVSSTPVSPVVPIGSPVIGVAHPVVTLPVGSATPSLGTFLTAAGATINHGTLAADLSGLSTSTVGSYPVTITGTDGDIPSVNPQAVTVKVVPVITVANPTVYIATGSAPSPAYIRSIAGARISAGTLDLPSLAAVNFGTPGTYALQFTGSANGISATPVPGAVKVVNQGGPPVITLANPSVAYQVGSAPTPAQVATAAGASITPDGTLDPISLAGVDFGTPGSYAVDVHGVNGDTAQPADVTLNIDVVAVPVITTAHTTISIPFGTVPSSAAVLAAAGASINHGTLGTVDMSSVNVNKIGSYGVSIIGADRGVPALPKNLVVKVTSVASHSLLKIYPTKVKYPKTVAISVTVTAPGAKAGKLTGKVAIYQGTKLIKSLTLSNGKASYTVKLAKGKHPLHAKYLGNSSWAITSSVSSTITVTVT